MQNAVGEFPWNLNANVVWIVEDLRNTSHLPLCDELSVSVLCIYHRLFNSARSSIRPSAIIWWHSLVAILSRLFLVAWSIGVPGWPWLRDDLEDIRWLLSYDRRDTILMARNIISPYNRRCWRLLEAPEPRSQQLEQTVFEHLLRSQGLKAEQIWQQMPEAQAKIAPLTSLDWS
jgi:hypothetical protein